MNKPRQDNSAIEALLLPGDRRLANLAFKEATNNAVGKVVSRNRLLVIPGKQK